MAGKTPNLKVEEQTAEERPDPEVVAKPRRRTFVVRHEHTPPWAPVAPRTRDHRRATI